MKWTDRLRRAPARVLRPDSSPAPESVVLHRLWRGDRCRPTLANHGPEPIAIGEVVLFDLAHDLPAETPLWAEAFQMLSQSAGTLAAPTDVGDYADRGHYKIPEPDGLRTGYGALALAPPGQERLLLGFASCRRFLGRFGFDGNRLRISLDTEGKTLAPGQIWELEDFVALAGADRDTLFDRLAAAIVRHHPRLCRPPVPNGWCSWYCFGPDVTARDIAENLEWIAKNLPDLRFIQIDDGYQPQMGDWLDTGNAFGGSVQSVLQAIQARGFEPALWVAPFIASPDSRLFSQHPDWFVKDADGRPLRSDTIGFGGWRLGPWYCLDGTHPEAQRHLASVFRTMNREWGVTYFKLDANYWGAIHGGRHFDKNATRIEAYRRGMEAVRRGAGANSLLLGCNHPIWPSLGLIDASRSSNDIGRSWTSFTRTGRENLLRGWQNGRLWWNDPDCLVLSGALPENEFLFHATLLYATGGMLLSGDDLPKLPPERVAILQKMLPATGVCARFADEGFSVGKIVLPDRTRWALLNWDETPARRTIPLERPSRLRDAWTGADLGTQGGAFTLELPPRSARLVEVA